MSKFLWFLGGCATGLLAAAAIGYICEDSADSADCALSPDEDHESFTTMREDIFTVLLPSRSDGPGDADVIVPTI